MHRALPDKPTLLSARGPRSGNRFPLAFHHAFFSSFCFQSKQGFEQYLCRRWVAMKCGVGQSGREHRSSRPSAKAVYQEQQAIESSSSGTRNTWEKYWKLSPAFALSVSTGTNRTPRLFFHIARNSR